MGRNGKIRYYCKVAHMIHWLDDGKDGWIAFMCVVAVGDGAP